MTNDDNYEEAADLDSTRLNADELEILARLDADIRFQPQPQPQPQLNLENDSAFGYEVDEAPPNPGEVYKSRSVGNQFDDIRQDLIEMKHDASIEEDQEDDDDQYTEFDEY